jgi:cold shock CspA family protein
MFRPFTELNLGFANAENYRKRENRELLRKYFVRDDYLEKILNPNVYFLVGEKGTGKTAYATFLQVSDYKNHTVSIFDVRQTEYQKFLELKKHGHLVLSQFPEVWRTLLLMAVTTSILERADTPRFLARFTRLRSLKQAIDEFYGSAFAPEIVKMMDFVQSSERAVSLIGKYSGAEAKGSYQTKDEIKDHNAVFQTNLLRVRQAFETALTGLKLESHVLLFIDGIDVRPSNIAYEDYFECVSGLIEAIWAINNDFFANMKDMGGRRIRIVLLVRPDIFLQTGLHNLNTKLRDNSVFLNWMTTYKDHRSSLLFKVADRLLAAQQTTPPMKVGSCWDYYFPFQAENIKDKSLAENGEITSFLSFLRFSYYRPRDINSMMSMLQEFVAKKGVADYVTAESFADPSFRDAHAEYLLGEIRDQLLFYYSRKEYELFLQFFLYLKGKQKFTYSEFVEAFNEFIEECNSSGKELPQFFETADLFLQFLYEQNVICYLERDQEKPDPNSKKKKKSELFIRWCFRERTLANMAPKVRSGVEYEIFYGLSKALNVGKVVRISKPRLTREIGTITHMDEDKGFGFVRGGPKQIDYYFKLTDYQGGPDRPPRLTLRVSFEVHVKYGKLRARGVRPSSGRPERSGT